MKSYARHGTTDRHDLWSLVLGVSLLSTSRQAWAEDAGEDVVVKAPQSSGFVSRTSLEASPREITDAASLLEPLPGVYVRRYGADDGFATLSIRGTSSSEVAIYLAGVPLTGGADPSLDLSTLPLWPGTQAAAYRSFAPAALGPGSLGGTLTLDPPRAGDARETEAWGAVGSYGSLRMRLGDLRALDDAKDGAQIATAFSASRSDDDFTYFDPIRNVFARRENAGHADVNGLLSLSLPVQTNAAEGRWTVTALAQVRRQELPGTIANPTPFEELMSNREVLALELSLRAGRGAVIARAWGKREDLRLTDDPLSASIDLSPAHTNDTIVASGGSLGWRGRPFHDVNLDARIDGGGERFAPGTYVDAAQPPGASRVSIGAALDADVHPSRDVTLNASGRGDAWSETSETGDGHHTEVRPTGHLGTEIALGRFTLAAHGGATARPPSFVERYGNRGGFIGDPDLRTESAWTGDAGIRTQGGTRAAGFAAEVDGFATWAHDLIVFVNEGAYGRAKATNIGRARIVGAEAHLDAHAFGVTFRASYTGLATANESECAAESGPLTLAATCERPGLPGRPAHDLVTDVSYRVGAPFPTALDGLTLRYGVDALAGTLADIAGNVTVPARVLQSAGARLDVPHVPGLRIAFDLRNLANVRVASYAGVIGPTREPIGDFFQYPLPGRTFLLTARYVIPY